MTEEQDKNILRLTMKFVSLGYNAKFSHFENGPIITQYFFHPDPLAPLSKVIAKAEDFALSCGVEAVVIAREKGLLNVSVPNKDRHRIDFDSVLYWLSQQHTTGLPLLMGCTPTGNNFTLDLCVQPHILIAGSTGGGKSVFLSQLIASLVLMKSPEELKMLLIDTKQV